MRLVWWVVQVERDGIGFGSIGLEQNILPNSRWEMQNISLELVSTVPI